MTQVGDWYWTDLPSVGSTNDEAAARTFNPQAEKFVVSAKVQTAGRGRRGRSWQSLEGNLFMSLALPGSLRDLNFLPFVTSLALLKTITELAPEADVSLKWPNDVLLGGAKISGILLEKPENKYIVIGIGVNIKDSPAADSGLLYPVAGLKSFGIDIDRCVFLKRYLRRFDETYDQVQRQGFAAVREQWLQHAARLNDEITVNLENSALHGIFRGIDVSGALLLEHDGKTDRIFAGDVFIKRKTEVNE